METTIDAAGRIVVPEAPRDALGLVPGSTVDISACGDGLHVSPGGRTARIVEEDGLVIAGETVVDDEIVHRLIDAGRR